MSDLESVIRWVAMLYAVGFAGLPIAAKVLGGSARRAVWFSRPAGLLAFFLPAWFLASVIDLPFDRPALVVSLVLVTAGGWFWFVRSGRIRVLDLREVVVAELVTLAAFLGAVWLRGFNPDILNTEKPMDSAFLSSVIHSNQMPPPDPWMAGETINYYYIGYAIHGAVAKVSGVISPVAFNLALATTTAIAIAAAIGCAVTFAPKLARIAGPLAAFFVVIAGNMDGPYRVLREGREAWDASWWQGMGWGSSRIVVDGEIQTINEFPAFSIILGDLHPHLMTLPFALFALGIAAAILRNENKVDWVQIGFAGVVGGALYGLNSWDLPTYFGLIILATVWNLRDDGSKSIALRVGGMIVAALVAWAPFVASFTPFVAGDPGTLPDWLQGIPIVESALTIVAVNDIEFTSAGEFLRIFGLFYAAIVIAMLVAARRISFDIRRDDAKWMIGLPVVGLLMIALLANAPLFILVGIPALLAVAIVKQAGPTSAEGTVAILYLAGGFIVLLTELFYIQDAFGDRMNTLFKAHYQVWTLWALGAAIGLAWLAVRAARVEFKVVVSVAIAGSLVLGMIYPVVSSARWTNDFEEWRGLDGTRFVADFSEDELAGIDFIREHASEDSVVLEAPGCSYRPLSRIPFNRVSAYTGVPTVIGWPNHEGQWRSGDDLLRNQIGPRRELAQQFYTSPTAGFIDAYGIDFVYFGIYEQGDGQDQCDWAGALPRPDHSALSALGFEIVFEQGDVTIWQRTG